MAYTEKPEPDIQGRDQRPVTLSDVNHLAEKFRPAYEEEAERQLSILDAMGVKVDSWHRPIGLLGYAGAGKDWLARQLMAAEPAFQRVSFADAVRALALRIDPMVASTGRSNAGRLSTLVELFGWDESKKNPEVRRVLQEVGMGVRDLIGEDVWVTAAGILEKARQSPVVVTDVRFPNEAALIERLDGVLVRILRPGVGPVNGHRSETALDGWPTQMVVWNDERCDRTLREMPQGGILPDEALPALLELGRSRTSGRLRS